MCVSISNLSNFWPCIAALLSAWQVTRGCNNWLVLSFNLKEKRSNETKNSFHCCIFLGEKYLQKSLFLFFTSRTSFSFCVLIKLPYNATETGPLLKCISKVKQFCFSLITGMIAMKIRKHQGLPIVSNYILVSVSILHKKQQISAITEWSAWNEWKYQIEHIGAIEFESYKSNFETWL